MPPEKCKPNQGGHRSSFEIESKATAQNGDDKYEDGCDAE